MPFILEFYKPPLLEKPPKTIYCINQYEYPVKDSNWQDRFEAEPFDINPYSNEKYSLHLSHYKRFGNYNEKPLQHPNKIIVEAPKKDIINFYSYTEDLLGAHDQYLMKDYLKTYDDNFLTTFQSSYTPPFPYKMKRLALPKTPLFANRRLAPQIGQKFIDDTYQTNIIQMQNCKRHQHNSFNPMTGKYTLHDKK